MRFALSFLLCLGAGVGPALANSCHDFWYARNSLFNAAGYCFGSVLGQTHFDNSDCIGKDVALSAADKAKVARLRGLEKAYGCRTNTSQRRLDIDDLAYRKQMRVQPMPGDADAGEVAACLNWTGGRQPLRDAPNSSARTIATIENGTYVLDGYLDEAGWSYAVVNRKGTNTVLGAGWVAPGTLSRANCTEWIP